jgi:cytochrome c5
MKQILVYALTGIFIVTLLSFAYSAETGKDERGKNLYSNKCQMCHGIKGDGNGPAASAFSPGPADFTNPKFWQNNSENKIADTIKNGMGAMPPFNLESDEIKAIIKYMSHTFKIGA